MVISDEWSSYKEDDVAKAQSVKETLLNDNWWMNVDYILAFTTPIYDVLRKMDTDMATLHLVYEMWDSMIEKVRNVIFQHERKTEVEHSSFFEVVNSILIDRWTKSSTISSLSCSLFKSKVMLNYFMIIFIVFILFIIL